MKNFLRKSVREIEVLVFTIILIMVFTLLQSRFFSAATFVDIFEQATLNCFLAIGVMIPIITGGIDLSVGSIVAVVACSVAWLSVNGVNPWLCMLAGIALGFVIGFLNGVLVSKMHLQPFIATLATQQIIRGIGYVRTGGWPILKVPGAFRDILNGKFLDIRIFVYVMLVSAIVIGYILKKTKFGVYIYAIGANREAAKLSGVNITRNEILAYCLSGVLAAMAGLIMVARMGAGEPATADGYESDAIAAAAIGGASLAGGKGTVPGAVFGSIMIYVLKVGLIMIGMNSFVQLIAIGVVLIFACYLDRIQDVVVEAWKKRKVHKQHVNS